MSGQPGKRARRSVADALPAERKPSNGRARKAGRTPAAPAPTLGPDEESFSAWQDKLSATDKIVEEIIMLMSTGRWIPGFSEKELAEKHNRSPDRIVHLAVEASRAVRRAVRAGDDFDEMCRAECLTTFRSIRAIAMAKATAQGATNVGTVLMAAIHATRMFGFYTGIEPARKTEDVTPNRDPFEGWTREELDHYAATGEEPRKQLTAGAPELGLGPGVSGKRLH